MRRLRTFPRKVIYRARSQRLGVVAKQVKPASRRKLRQIARQWKDLAVRRQKHLRDEQRFETYRAAVIMCASNNCHDWERKAQWITKHIEKRRPAPFKE